MDITFAITSAEIMSLQSCSFEYELDVFMLRVYGYYDNHTLRFALDNRTQ